MRKFVDIEESYDGDIVIEDGDLKTTKNNSLQAVSQLLSKWLRTTPGESFIFPEMGFDDTEIVGMQNTPQLGKRIERIISDLISDNTKLFKGEFEVKAFPTGPHSVGVRVKFFTLSGKEDAVLIVFDTADGKIKMKSFVS